MKALDLGSVPPLIARVAAASPLSDDLRAGRVAQRATGGLAAVASSLRNLGCQPDGAGPTLASPCPIDHEHRTTMQGRPAIGQSWSTLNAAAWSAAIDDVVFSVTSDPKSPDTFSAAAEMWSLGEVKLLHHVCDAIQYRREPRHVRAERDEFLLVPFSVDTLLRFAQNGVERLCRPNQFIIERSGYPFAFQQETRGELWTLKIPAAAMRQNVRGFETFVPHVYEADRGAGGLLLDLLRMVPHRLAGEPESAAATDLGGIVIDLLVAALQNDERILGSQQGSVRRAHLTRIERYIRLNLGNPALEPSMVAGANGISLRYLHKLFSDSGTSVNQWIVEQRLEACDRDLRRCRKGETVAEIGYRWGFGDAAHFSRAFKARFGLSPRERRAV